MINRHYAFSIVAFTLIRFLKSHSLSMLPFVSVSISFPRLFSFPMEIRCNFQPGPVYFIECVLHVFVVFIFSALVYEMLYKKVFKLPDIEYSVETMLHCSDINEPSKYEYENGDDYPTHIVFEDGRKFELDRPGKLFSKITTCNQCQIFNSNLNFISLNDAENTQCILKEKDRCHFHNKNFEECIKHNPRRYEKNTLSDKFNSCVRQLFFDGEFVLDFVNEKKQGNVCQSE